VISHAGNAVRTTIRGQKGEWAGKRARTERCIGPLSPSRLRKYAHSG
jgi:hypothetical protein